MEVFHKLEKILTGDKCCILWLTYQQGKMFEKFRANNKSINLVNNFGINRLATAFKTLIVKFLNKYPKMKKSIIKEISHENASEFKWHCFCKLLHLL